MKLIKFLMFIALVSVITYSCKESKKEDVNEEMEVVSESESADGVEEVEVVEIVEVEKSTKTEKSAEAIEGNAVGLEAVVTEGVIVETMADTPVIYPGCAGSNEEIRACSKKKFVSFLGTNFNSDLASDLGLKSGEHKIRALLKIDESGKASVLKVDGPNKSLEKEVVRVIDKLPTMAPATKEGKPVSVSFVLPINFKVD